MAIRKYKPTTSSRRGASVSSFDTVTRSRPEKSLTGQKARSGGRNVHGRMTSRNKGGGHKRRFRQIDFRRDKDGVPGVVERLEYDPNRSAHIALIKYADGERRYILAPRGVAAGTPISSGIDAPIKPGNALPLRNVPVGTVIHNIELKPGKGGQIARSAGVSAQLVAREGTYATLRLKSGEMRRVLTECRATIGEVGNSEHSLRSLGKAGATRWRGVRPTVRGVVMNPVDHPHGGGEGKTSGGRHPVSPWGVPTKGHKTRKNKRTDKMIVRRRRSRK